MEFDVGSSDLGKKYGDVSRLPTTTFFYGRQEQEESAVEIDQGKSLVIRLQGRSEIEADGADRLFYELNGQPRAVRVDRAGAKAAHARPTATEGDIHQIGPPMPGMVSLVAVKAGDVVRKVDPLISL